MTTKQPKFEEAYGRLEQILEKMNSGTIGLDDSIKLYEEADSLIAVCGKRLADAEHKVETLIKKRTGELSMNNGNPETETFGHNA